VVDLLVRWRVQGTYARTVSPGLPRLNAVVRTRGRKITGRKNLWVAGEEGPPRAVFGDLGGGRNSISFLRWSPFSQDEDERFFCP